MNLHIKYILFSKAFFNCKVSYIFKVREKIYFIFQGVLYLQSVIHIQGTWKNIFYFPSRFLLAECHKYSRYVKKYILFSKAFFTCRVSYIFKVREKNIFYFPSRFLLAECHTYSRYVKKIYFIFQAVFTRRVSYIFTVREKIYFFSKVFFTCRVSYIFTVREKIYFNFQAVFYLQSVIHIHGTRKNIFYFPRRSLLAECHTYSRYVKKFILFSKAFFTCRVSYIFTVRENKYIFVYTPKQSIPFIAPFFISSQLRHKILLAPSLSNFAQIVQEIRNIRVTINLRLSVKYDCHWVV